MRQVRSLPVWLKAKLASAREYKPHWLHDGHAWAHLAYFGAVFVEGHGIYASMGGILLVIGLLMIFFKAGEV